MSAIGLIYGEIQEIEVDLEIAKKITKFRVEHFPGKNLLLATMKPGKIAVNKEARDYFSSKDGCSGLIKIAQIVDSPLMNMFGNIFIKLAKPAVPRKLFKDPEQAKLWLKEK
jgi:hypothetical protein